MNICFNIYMNYKPFELDFTDWYYKIYMKRLRKLSFF